MRSNLPTKNIRLKKNYSFGFTIIEILVVISITAIVGGIGFASFANYSRQQLVEQTARDIKQMFEEARASAIAQKKPHIHPVTGPNPQICFFDFDRDGVQDPGEGDMNEARELRGYRIRAILLSGVWRYRTYAVCRRPTNELVNTIVKEKILPKDITVTSPIPCNASPDFFFYESLTNIVRCNGSPPTTDRTITISGPGGVTRNIIINSQGNLRIQ